MRAFRGGVGLALCRPSLRPAGGRNRHCRRLAARLNPLMMVGCRWGTTATVRAPARTRRRLYHYRNRYHDYKCDDCHHRHRHHYHHHHPPPHQYDGYHRIISGIVPAWSSPSSPSLTTKSDTSVLIYQATLLLLHIIVISIISIIIIIIIITTIIVIMSCRAPA